ncbi:uncharacterized protein N7483_003780 [Penicillium malachiteum]|uniref:uncharacterized protein n=1 Tax=Penicillium malachiteum TaxID=1324776 RepID=UPI0025483924|nr:uncharacterized protein N7483_003780 [Penicillium malachiteum]KAJ5729272.1 hypothetical protein N7483_003780 [Penicillium malachiteum]
MTLEKRTLTVPTEDPNKRPKTTSKTPRKIDKAFLPLPPIEAVIPDRGVPKPDIFDEVPLGPYVSSADAKLAYKVWSLPDQALGEAWKGKEDRPYCEDPTDSVTHALSHNVYEHLMTNPLLPISREDASGSFEADGLNRDWNASLIIDEFRDSLLQESSIRDISLWSKKAIRKLLKSRDLTVSGDEHQDDLIKRAQQDELEKHCGIVPLSDLEHWSIKRPQKYAVQPYGNEHMSTLSMYTFAIHLSPYNPTYWVSRAYCHYQQAYLDLALGDAYRAKVLCDVLVKASERSRRVGLYPKMWHAIEQHLLAKPRGDNILKPEIQQLREKGPVYFINCLTKALDNIIVLSLAGLGCWHDLDPKYSNLGSTSILHTQDRDGRVPRLRKEVLAIVEQKHKMQIRNNLELFWHERFTGRLLADRVYPYEPTDVDLGKPDFVKTINRNIFQDKNDPGDFKKVCRVEKLEDSSGGPIGVFAKSNIKAGQLVYYEEPTIRGHLRPRRMERDETAGKEDPKCDNCQRAMSRIEKFESPCACCQDIGKPSPDDRNFCRRSKEKQSASCKELASQIHHFSSCGKDWSWLHNAIRPIIKEWKGEEYVLQCNDVHGTMHSLLLRNIFEITLHRRDNNPNLSPLEINELLVLDDERECKKGYFPFSYIGNITVPFDILTSLGVDIFRDFSCDTWVIQRILQKLLIYAVPWDPERCDQASEFVPGDIDKTPEHPDRQDERIQEGRSFKKWDPSFMNLHLFPGLSMFRQVVSENASWGYSTKVPNRVMIWAIKDIKKGEEIAIRNQHHSFGTSEKKFGPTPTTRIKQGIKYSRSGTPGVKPTHKRDSEYATVDDIRLSFKRDVPDSNPVTGYQRDRETEPRHFPRGHAHAHPDVEEWLQDLLDLKVESGDTETLTEDITEEEWLELKQLGLKNYRDKQRANIDFLRSEVLSEDQMIDEGADLIKHFKLPNES